MRSHPSLIEYQWEEFKHFDRKNFVQFLTNKNYLFREIRKRKVSSLWILLRFIQSPSRGENCRLFSIASVCKDTNGVNTSAKYIIIRAERVFAQYEERAMESVRKSWKLITFRFTHFFSFIHLARLCIVYYFCRFSVVQGKSLRENRARERNIAN